ncbi:MAG: DNA repair protein RadC [Chthoniobacteraceae bacterium]
MGSLKIHELPSQERPREKLAALGAGALSESELIAILLRTGVQGANAVDVGRELIKRFGSLGGLTRASVQELAAVHGVGPAKATQLAAAFELGTRLARESLTGMPLDTPARIYELLGTEMRQLGKESLRVVMLDTKLRLLRTEEVSLGSLNECLAHPREILRPVVLQNAFAFILVHNHPSGDPSPSDADRRLTVRIADAARLMQVTFSDHIIIGSPAPGRPSYFSFREAGIL